MGCIADSGCPWHTDMTPYETRTLLTLSSHRSGEVDQRFDASRFNTLSLSLTLFNTIFFW
jgi:hypothetical protein